MQFTDNSITQSNEGANNSGAWTPDQPNQGVGEPRKWWQIPFTNTNYHFRYDFKSLNHNSIPAIFIGTGIIGPFLISIILRLIFGDFSNLIGGYSAVVIIVNTFGSWILVGIGLYVISTKIPVRQLIASGANAFYIFYYVPGFINLVISLVIGLLAGNNLSEQSKGTINLVMLFISDLIAVLLCFWYSPVFRHKIIYTIKKDFKIYLAAIIFYLVFAYVLNFLFGLIQTKINPGKSANQSSLESSLNLWWNALLLGIATIFVAPFIEEMATRHSIFLFSGRPVVGWFVSVIYFAGMHVTSNGDWENILGYLGASAALATIFVSARYNVTYSISIHMLLNLITYILIMSKVSV